MTMEFNDEIGGAASGSASLCAESEREVTETVDRRRVDVEGNAAPEPEPQEVHGKVEDFVPLNDYILVRRLAAVTQSGRILRPEVGVEQSERGTVVSVSDKLQGQIPLGAVVKFGKYNPEEIVFDDQGNDKYILARIFDCRGYHKGSDCYA